MDIHKINRSKRLSSTLLRSLTDADLTSLRVLYDKDIASIATQLQALDNDDEWIARAKTAKRMKGRSSQQIQSELARRKAERREQHEYACALLKAMDQLLAAPTKELIVGRAKRLLADARSE